MDLQMPVMDGIQATKRIKEFMQTNAIDSDATRIVAVTAYQGQEIRQQCM